MVTTNFLDTGRTQLRDFQERLAERVREAQDNDLPDSMLGIEAASCHWLVSLAEAGEIVPVPNITEVPLTQPWFRGLANVRGVLVSVIDLSLFMGLNQPTPTHKESRLMVPNPLVGQGCGILLKQVQGLRKIDEMTLVSDSTAKPDWIGRIWLDKNDVKWYELKLHVLTTGEQFLHVAI